MKRLTLVALFAATMVLSLAAAQAAVNLTGKWLFSVETSAGNGTPTVTLKQDGEKLTGHYSSATLGEADLTGTVKGNAITFTFTASVQGAQVPVTYTGTIENKDSLKGDADLGAVGKGTFTAKRQ